MAKAKTCSRAFAYAWLLTYTAVFLLSLWLIVYLIGTSNSSTPTTYSSIVATDPGIRLEQGLLIAFSPFWFAFLYFYVIEVKRDDPYIQKWIAFRLFFGANLFGSSLGINLVGPAWEVFHEVLAWWVYASYIGLVLCGVRLHIYDTVVRYAKVKKTSKKVTWWNALSAYKFRSALILGEFTALVLTVVLGSISFKVCGATTTCRQAYEFASITFASTLSAFYVLEIEIAEMRTFQI